MKKYLIFYQTTKTFTPLHYAIHKLPYDYAGFVYAENLESAYFQTQNLKENWNQVNSCRSTMIGDIIVDQASGFRYKVEAVGFSPMLETYEIN